MPGAPLWMWPGWAPLIASLMIAAWIIVQVAVSGWDKR